MKTCLYKLILLVGCFSMKIYAESYKVVFNPNSPPKSFRDEQGLIVGIDVDIIQAIAKIKNFEVEIFSADKKLPTIDSKQYDIALSINITDKRKEKYNVSEPYFISYTTAYHSNPDVLTSTSIENLGNLRVVAIPDTSKANLLKNAGIQIIPAKTPFLGMKMVLQGKADIFVSDNSILQYLIKENPKLDAHLTNLSIENEIEISEYGIVVRKSDTELMKKINAGLMAIKSSGEYDRIIKSWLDKEP